MHGPLREAIGGCLKGLTPWPLLICGPVGCGKTATILLLTDYVGWSLYRETARLCQFLVDIRDGLDMGTDHADYWTPHRFWLQWSAAKLTVLDDLGAQEKVTDHRYQVVMRAIEDRYGEPAVFISNLPLTELAVCYDDRIASRLSAGSIIHLPPTMPDYRVTKEPNDGKE